MMPNYLFSQELKTPYEELIGKGNPELFGQGYELRKEAHLAFLAMKEEAAKSDILLKAVSSYRSYASQKRIWERKFKSYISKGLSPLNSIDKIIKYSTIPGTSRHHWGTDIDIVDGNFIDTPNLLSEQNFYEGAPFYNLKIWLEEYSEKFGFYLVYNNNPKRKGFKYEPWHFSYKALSMNYLEEYRNLDILKVLQSENFEGSEYFSLEFMNTYIKENIMDINPNLVS
jgi:LAS superfamily LD-carboxypeptidase LdcB